MKIHNKIVIYGKTGQRQLIGNVYQTEYYTSTGVHFIDDDTLGENYIFLSDIDYNQSSHHFISYHTYASVRHNGFLLIFLDQKNIEIEAGIYPSLETIKKITSTLSIPRTPMYLLNIINGN